MHAIYDMAVQSMVLESLKRAAESSILLAFHSHKKGDDSKDEARHK